MQSVLITGGAGFIGQNLVHAWRRARPDDRLTVIDAMTYAANVRSLQPLIADGRVIALAVSTAKAPSRQPRIRSATSKIPAAMNIA